MKLTSKSKTSATSPLRESPSPDPSPTAAALPPAEEEYVVTPGNAFSLLKAEAIRQSKLRQSPGKSRSVLCPSPLALNSLSLLFTPCFLLSSFISISALST